MSKFIDLTGQRFGRLTVAYRINKGWSMDKALNIPIRRLINEHYLT